MTRWIVILLISTIATLAQADESRSSAFHCGFKVGSGKSAEPSRFGQPRLKQVPALYQPLPLRTQTRADLFPQQAAAKTGERRLLREFTVARFVCSWR